MSTIIDWVKTAFKDKAGEIALGLIIATLTTLWNVGKKWFQQGNARDKQMVLSFEADRLTKLHETLAKASDPSPTVTRAQAAVGNQLNRVLENLSHLLTDSEASSTHSPLVAIIGKYLLLYRATGVISVLMHWIFYLLGLTWLLISLAGFDVNSVGANLAVTVVLLIPAVLWNYLTRKTEAWLHHRQAAAASSAAVSEPSRRSAA